VRSGALPGGSAKRQKSIRTSRKPRTWPRRFGAVGIACALSLPFPALAAASRRPTRAQLASIAAGVRRYGKNVEPIRIVSARESSFGPYAEALISSPLGRAQLELKRLTGHWRVTAVTSEEGPSCGTPARVVVDLHLVDGGAACS
jgi:hypothetical protein